MTESRGGGGGGGGFSPRTLAVVLLLALCIIDSWALPPPSCPSLPPNCGCVQNNEDEQANGEVGAFSVQCTSNSSSHISLAEVLHSIRDTDVSSLIVNGCVQTRLGELPSMKKLVNLELSNCAIESVDPKAFRAVASTLQTLSLVNNSLMTLPPLGRLPRLRSLNLNDNQIFDFPPDSFSGTPALRQLRAERNRICAFSPNSLDETRGRLELLDLSGNCFTAIPAAAIRAQSSLKYLDLSDNLISEIAPLTLVGLSKLIELRLSGNRLTRLSPLVFGESPALQHLQARDNLIEEVDEISPLIHSFRKLEILDLTNNSLSKLPSFTGYQSLRQLRLDHNNIDSIEENAFNGARALQLISIQSNSLQSIEHGAFTGLSKLLVLMLSGNSISKLESDTLVGLSSLQQLSLRNNRVTHIDPTAFVHMPALTTIDLSGNRLGHLDPGTFILGRLFWLDLSQNKLHRIDRTVFGESRVSNILMNDNPWDCDERLDAFVQYLVLNRVRTTLPSRNETICAAPARYASLPLRELMMRKANETLAQLGQLGFDPRNDATQRSPFASLFPQMFNRQGEGGSAAAATNAIPMLGTLTKWIPSLRSIPGLNGNGPSAISVGQAASSVSSTRSSDSGLGRADNNTNEQLDAAIEQFAGPLVRFATGGQPVESDLEQLLGSIPDLVVNSPGFADSVDLSKVNPDLLSHVARGGKLPGVPADTMTVAMKRIMSRMADAAKIALQDGQQALSEEQRRLLPPLDALPPQLVEQVMAGNQLPGLDTHQTSLIKDYYMMQVPQMIGDFISGGNATRSGDGESAGGSRPTIGSMFFSGGSLNASAIQQFIAPVLNEIRNLTLHSPAIDLMRLLPPNYDFTKLPQDVVEAVARGELPPFDSLPAELRDHLRGNSDRLLAMFAKQNRGNETLESLLGKLPRFDPPELNSSSTFSPYDINKLNAELGKTDADKEENDRKTRLYLAIALSVLGAVSLLTIIGLVICLRRAQFARIVSPVVKSKRNGRVPAIPSSAAPSLARRPTPFLMTSSFDIVTEDDANDVTRGPPEDREMNQNYKDEEEEEAELTIVDIGTTEQH